MTIWEGEIKELDKLYDSFKGHLPDIMKEMEQLIRTDDANVVMLYSRRCLEVIITDLCENELKRPRKTEPLKGIIDKLNSEEKVPSYIITSMQSLNSMATYGAHPKDFDPEQVKPVLINLAIVIRWYLKYKDFKIISKTDTTEGKHESKDQIDSASTIPKLKKRYRLLLPVILLGIVIVIIAYSIIGRNKNHVNDQKESVIANSIDSIDSYTYRKIKIGNQVWMAENLKTTRYNDGTLIPLVTDSTAWENLKTPAFCWYNNDEATSKSTYGAFYNWYAVNTAKLCPLGWHVPSAAEWDTLANYLGHDSVAVEELKETGTAHWASPNTGATNKSGFTALPGGLRIKTFKGVGDEGNWWSSSESKAYEASYAFYQTIDKYYYYHYINDAPKEIGFSVRCVRN